MFTKFGNGFFNGLKSFFSKEKILILCIFLVLIWALTKYSSDKVTVGEKMSTGEALEPVEKDAVVQPASKQNAAEYSAKDTALPTELLPHDENNKFKELNPTSMNKGDILMPDLLDAGKHLGMQSNVLRNANNSLRPDPPIPQVDTGVWNQSTIERDANQVPFDIGQSNAQV